MIQAALATTIGLSHELDAMFAWPSRPARPAPLEGRRTAPASVDPAEDAALCALVARVGASDAQALQALYDATVGRVYAMARGIARNPQCAEDMTEDVYWQVWRKAVRFDRPRGPVMAWLIRAEAAGARLFLRWSAPAAPATGLLHFSTVQGEDGWDDFCPGVRIKPLWQGGERSSMLVRMQAGAGVNAHRHRLEEECLMLAGEAFVGDTLLRSGDYQLAPMGSRHGAVTTDVGALLYVHGSLDPAAYL